jgi:dipeptidyl aminopeptidase/acylaminoacyl peptidase
MGRLSVWGVRVFVAMAATLVMATTAQAQYFGRNKVQYRDFKFEVLKTDHFDIYFYAEERDAAADVARLAERWYARLSVMLDHNLSNRQPVVLYGSHADFEQTNVVGGEIGEGTGGVTEGLKRRVVLPLTGALKETDHVLGHELVHAFQYDMARVGSDQGQTRGPSIERLPLWFVEGMAEYLSLGPIDPNTAMWMRDAVRHEMLPDIRKLGDPKYFPYRWGQALWAYIGGRFGDRVVGQVFNDALSVGPDAAFENILGQKSKDLSAAWQASLREHYNPIIEATKRPPAFGRPLSTEIQLEKKNPPLYSSPVLSPNGQQIVVFSERGMLSVDMYLADANTGAVIRKLVSTAIDPHYSSLQFVNSAGSWNPNNREFVVGAVRSGHPVLAIIDTKSGKRVREKAFAELGEIMNPAWSPNGRTIAFSAMSGGYSDLYLYDLMADSLKRLTNDRFADLEPAWSPDGNRIAFVTDRYSTKLPTLAAGSYGLAILDPASGSVERVQTFDEAKNINPQWSGDGKTLYFVSDPFGISNVFALDLSARTVRQITNVDTGVSGITDISPALTVATGMRRVAWSVHDETHPTVYVTDNATVLEGGRPAATWSDVTAALLPPERRKSTELVAALADPVKGLPEKTGETEEYKAKLGLDMVGQPYVGAGYSRFGPTFGGGISFLWSDVLGNHNLAAVVDANTYGGRFSDILKDTGGIVAYQNLTHKWDWGVSVEQSPYLAGGVASGFSQVGGQPVIVEQDIIQRQTFRAVSGAVSRPLSLTRRVEFSSSFQNVLFEEEVRTLTASAQTGQLLSDETETTRLADPLRLVSGGAAFVLDSAVFGATSPVAGQRGRIEMTPTFGTIQYTSALADYRRYFMPANFYTIATRVLHYGRYGSGGEDFRLVPMFIGYPQLVRGYGIGSISANECTPTANGSCPEFDRLIGSRMLVANVEFRFPLLRPFGATGRMYGPVPTEVAFFADGGTAWNRGEKPSFVGGDRQPVTSAGVSLRLNAFNFAVVQIDYAHPFERAGKGWVWGFSLSPGF